MFHSIRLQKLTSILIALLLTLIFLAVPVSASSRELESVLTDLEDLQDLAVQYCSEPASSDDPLSLTINYIRAQRYNTPEWDLVLGAPSQAFAQYVASQRPDLQALQQNQLVTIPAVGAPVDFVHLIAGIGGVHQNLAAMCTWGGDAIQLANGVRSCTDLEQCMEQLHWQFGSQDENSSLWPFSDLMADLDAVNVGSILQEDDSLAQVLRQYYSEFSTEWQARQFVAIQLGGGDTGSRDAFRQQVRDSFLQNEGVQLLLLFQEQLIYDEAGTPAVIPEMKAPLDAVCFLLADYLSDAVGGAKIEAAEITQPEEAPLFPNGDSLDPEIGRPAAPDLPGEAPALSWLQAHSQLLLVVLIVCTALLVILLLYLLIKRD